MKVEEKILLTLSRDSKSFYTECCTLDVFYPIQLTKVDTRYIDIRYLDSLDMSRYF